MSKQSQASSLISALGTLIGYIGSEAATEDVFERLLWPQRFFNAVTWRDAFEVGLLLPMGGPIHKAALTTLDKFHTNGIFKGRDLGNMLGTAFFHDMSFKYREHDPSPGNTGKEYVRNGLWVQAISRIPTGEEQKPLLVRAKSAVNFLELSHVFHDTKSIDPALVIENDTGRITFRTLLALVWSEITAIATGAAVLGYWRSSFCLFWFFPLLLKLLSATCSIKREGLLPAPHQPASQTKECPPETEEPIKRFEINTRGNGFLIISGPESVVLQFFRHYGHPVRSRPREILQIIIIITLGFTFPAGLVASLIWMPEGMQYFWLGYQLYATIALYVARYTKGRQWATTEARMAAVLGKGCEDPGGGDGVVYLRDGKEGTVVKGVLTRVGIGRFKEGQELVESYFDSRGRDGEEKRGRSESEDSEETVGK
ncbi:uncharacterized protein KY384_005807 [Bacidia gigantensis]|uniref:uncharacterized protein n=1 Tax=Bacidia gigantensis TaxID=2732470 RepID=UPI001D0522FF|nr:uncharacterized protein KY384_005807 [Bacidia gigantensis]KAG8529172.1 hypothetical protein KY384_005807 [Bacidia gigantensis]